jgi:hypothetical protein
VNDRPVIVRHATGALATFQLADEEAAFAIQKTREIIIIHDGDYNGRLPSR